MIRNITIDLTRDEFLVLRDACTQHLADVDEFRIETNNAERDDDLELLRTIVARLDTLNVDDLPPDND